MIPTSLHWMGWRQVKDAHLEKKKALEAKAMATEEFFSLYTNLLREDALFCWDKIVSSQVGAVPWTDLQGYKHKQECGKSIESFQDCITFHLLVMFPGNAAKQQCFYISNVLKKPQQVEQLNIYLSHLPCTYDSPLATAVTKPIKAYDKAELANLLLRICPKS